MQQGDIVVAGTDGLLDNVFPDEAAAIATVAQRKGESPGVAAEVCDLCGCIPVCVWWYV